MSPILRSKACPGPVANSQGGLQPSKTPWIWCFFCPFVLLVLNKYHSILQSNIYLKLCISCLPPFKQTCLFIELNCFVWIMFATGIPFKVVLSSVFYPPPAVCVQWTVLMYCISEPLRFRSPAWLWHFVLWSEGDGLGEERRVFLSGSWAEQWGFGMLSVLLPHWAQDQFVKMILRLKKI
jgi:hypothetical protein